MQHDGKLENCLFRGPFFIKKKASREQILQNNENVSRPKYINKNTDISRSYPPTAIIACHQPKINSVRFEDPHNQINPIENTNNDTQIIDSHEEHIKEYAEEQLLFEDTN